VEVVPEGRVVVLSRVAATVVRWDWNKVRNTKPVPGSGKENDGWSYQDVPNRLRVVEVLY
jgi:hypothetical protein